MNNQKKITLYWLLMELKAEVFDEDREKVEQVIEFLEHNWLDNNKQCK